jgi:hypothetical protein
MMTPGLRTRSLKKNTHPGEATTPSSEPLGILLVMNPDFQVTAAPCKTMKVAFSRKTINQRCLAECSLIPQKLCEIIYLMGFIVVVFLSLRALFSFFDSETES